MRSTHSQRRCMHKLLKQHRIRCYMENVLKQTKRIKHAISHVFASCTRPKVKDEPIFNYDNVRSELRKNIENLIREIPVKELIQGEEMGSGANGSVGKCSFSYHAEHVAVKRIMIGDWGTVRDFIREVNLMARAASHENYPRLLGWAIDDSESGITGMIIMECFDHHLEHYFVRILNSEVPTPSMFQRIHLMIDYATALHYLHDAQNFVHGDVHLRNLMIKYGGSRVRGFVVDLGLSRDVHDKTPRGMYNLWTAPETMQTGYTRASEVFSFGLVMLSIMRLEKIYLIVPHCPLATVEPGIAIQWEYYCEGTAELNIPSFERFDQESPPAELAELLKQCLSLEHDQRPAIGHICRVLKEVHQKMQDEGSHGASTLSEQMCSACTLAGHNQLPTFAPVSQDGIDGDATAPPEPYVD